jgi:hypothetical protein
LYEIVNTQCLGKNEIMQKYDFFDKKIETYDQYLTLALGYIGIYIV